MTPVRTQQLVDDLRAFYKTWTARQKDLAASLDLTPQALNEILAGRNQPNSETTLRIQEFLKDKNHMPIRQPLFPSKAKTPSAALTSRHDDEPHTPEFRNLSEAKEEIQKLRTRIAQLGGNHLGAPAAPHVPAPATIPTRATLPTLPAPAKQPAVKPPVNLFAGTSVTDLISRWKQAQQDGKERIGGSNSCRNQPPKLRA